MQVQAQSWLPSVLSGLLRFSQDAHWLLRERMLEEDSSELVADSGLGEDEVTGTLDVLQVGLKLQALSAPFRFFCCSAAFALLRRAAACRRTVGTIC